MLGNPPGRLVLLVDPDEDTRRAYAQHLQTLGYDSDHAADGREALAKALTRCPAVVITETRLPGMSGYDLCFILGNDSATCTIPVVIVTAESAAAKLKRAEEAGAAAVLVKPCLLETLAAEIDRVVAEADCNRRAQSEQPTDFGRRQTKAMLSHVHQRRFTTAPPMPPPEVICPVCDKRLVYQHSHVGGVSAIHAEQWDYFECQGGCGTFQYRGRTRRLRKMS